MTSALQTQQLEAITTTLDGLRQIEEGEVEARKGVAMWLKLDEGTTEKIHTVKALADRIDQIQQREVSCYVRLREIAAAVRGFGADDMSSPSVEKLSQAMPTTRAARAYRQTTPETKEQINESVMNNPDAKYTPAQIAALEEYLENLREDNQRLEQENNRLQKECGEVFDENLARKQRVEQNGNHLVLGLPSWVASIDEFFKEERYYPDETKYIVREHLISIAHKLAIAGINEKSQHSPNPFTNT